MTETLKIVATGLPTSIEDYQLALNAAFAGGKAYGTAKLQQEVKKQLNEAIKHDEDWLERLYWEFDNARLFGCNERTKFKGMLRGYSTKCMQALKV